MNGGHEFRHVFVLGDITVQVSQVLAFPAVLVVHTSILLSLLDYLELVLSDQFLSQLHFGVVEQTKLEVIDLSSLVKVNLVEEDPIVGQGNMESNFVHALDKFPEVELA